MYHNFDPSIAPEATTDWMNEMLDKLSRQEASFSEARELAMLTIELSLDSCPRSLAQACVEDVTDSTKQVGIAYSLTSHVARAISDQYPDIQSTLERFQQALLAINVTAINGFSGSVESEECPRSTYIVRNPHTGHVKIGMSTSPHSRIKTLGMASGAELEILAVINGDMEAELHGRFSQHRTHGEWFDDKNGEIASFAKRASQ